LRVKMKVSLTGTRDGEEWPPRGQCADLPDDEATHLVTAGLAGPCAEPCAEPEPEPEPEPTPEPEPEVVETATAPRAPRTARRKG
jgi:hypothetical protein